MIPATLWTLSSPLLDFFYFYTAFRVGNLRGQARHQGAGDERPPAVDRAFRVQLNTLEQMGICSPVSLVSALYPIPGAWLAPLIGFHLARGAHRLIAAPIWQIRRND